MWQNPSIINYISDLNVELWLCLMISLTIEAVQDGCVGDASHKAV